MNNLRPTSEDVAPERGSAMARICDRSPCDHLLKALGNFIFGAPDREGGFYMMALVSDAPTEVSIEYCPYCGTRLEEVPSVVVERFMRPRRKKKTPAT